ncbi:MAG: undecaprenyldiphospho-muramoylpentapeptide beta-N-acetylglucosaminyltransferase [Deltaproteobacteria bacterium]|nr:undecaprenyldiphospho-muramoylpentapeptide beta-N-acetylglucosaminyltransferase [Deltaproteobacteria bacterium]
MKVLIAGGGTGGHVFPGVAVAEELRARRVDVVFAGTSRGLESTVVPANGFAFETIDVSGLMRVGLWGAVRGIARLPSSYFASRRILRHHKPNIVLGVGGYASGPLTLTAKAVGIPAAILEQNSIPGLTNRILGRVVDSVFASYESSRPFFPAKKFVLAGNPLRRRIVDVAERGEGFSNVASDRTSRAIRILVLGGSQGAHALNFVVPQALTGLESRVDVRHQSGERERDSVQAAYRERAISADVFPFIDDTANAYVCADIIISRAGATTLAEVAAIGRPAILVPLPTAANDHQTKNANVLAAAGAALVLPQAECTVERLGAVLRDLIDDDARREAMARASRAMGRPSAARDVADALVAMASANGDRT